MNVLVIEVTRRADGRRFPAPWPTASERGRARVICHALVCGDGLSYRAAQQALLGHGLRRSLGWISHTLSNYSCQRPTCPSVPVEVAAGG